MTPEERVEKFGWLNKLSGIEREEAIEKIVAPLRKFYENATDEQLREIQNKRDRTICALYPNEVEDSPRERREQEKWNRALDRIFLGITHEQDEIPKTP